MIIAVFGDDPIRTSFDGDARWLLHAVSFPAQLPKLPFAVIAQHSFSFEKDKELQFNVIIQREIASTWKSWISHWECR